MKILPRLNSAPIDDDRTRGLVVLNTVGSTPLVVSGLSLSGVGAITVAIVDGSGNQITSFGGGTQYANAAVVATPTGTVAMGFDGTNVRALKTDNTGALNITGSISANNASVGATAAAVPASATYLGANKSGNLVGLTLDASGNLNVLLANTSVAVTGTVTANAGTNLNTSLLALESGGNLATIVTNTNKIPSLGQALAAGSVPVVLTAAQLTTLTPPAAITNYALETGGNLATLAGAVSASKVQTNVTNTYIPVRISDSNGAGLSSNFSGSYYLDVASNAQAGTDSQASISSLNGFNTWNSFGGIIHIRVTGTWSGTLTFYNNNSADSTQTAVNGYPIGGGAPVGSTTSNGEWFFPTAAVSGIMVKMTSYSSGTAVVYGLSSSTTSYVNIALPLPTGTNSIGQVTANAGTNLNTSALALESGGNLAAIKADVDKIPSQGQALAAASMPVVLPAAQITTLTPPSNTGYALDSSLSTINTSLADVATLGAKTDAKSTATDATSVSIMQVLKEISAMEQAPASRAVTNAGTFAVQATLQTQTDTTMVGGVNVKEINGVTPLMGNGVTGIGSQRVTIASDNTVLPAVGAGATGSAVPANASYQGFDAATALPTAATAGNTVGGMSDKYGRQVVLPVTIRDLVGTQTTTITVNTETTIVTAAASTFNDLIMLVVSNTSATAVRVDFRDTTAGSILFSLYLPAGDTRGFSLGGVPIPQTSVNTNWTAQVSSAVTDIRVYAVFAKNK